MKDQREHQHVPQAKGVKLLVLEHHEGIDRQHQQQEQKHIRAGLGNHITALIPVTESQRIPENLISENKADSENADDQREPFFCDPQVQQRIHKQKNDGGLMEQVRHKNQDQKRNRFLVFAAEVTDRPDSNRNRLSQPRKVHGKRGKTHKERDR